LAKAGGSSDANTARVTSLLMVCRRAATAAASAVVALVAVLTMPSSARADVVPIPVRVVVVTTFELGADTGDAPGEFQYWVERLPLPETLALPQAYRHLRFNPARGVLGIVTGEGAERGAASIMALGSDPRFDLSKAYWVIAGIAGVDPNAASVGSAVWANWVVNADLAFEVDARDMPQAWTTGIVPFDRATPYASPAPPVESLHGVSAYELNANLVDWAYRLTAATPLADDTALRAVRAPYSAYPNALRPPFVLRGDTLSGDRFWIGASMNAWAERWVSYRTNDRGTFVTTAEEDAGIMQSLTFLAQAGRVDTHRVLVLRTASDYDMPGDRGDAASLLAQDASTNGESAYHEALEAAYRVASPVVIELSTHWERYGGRLPGGL
jgi:purine nucleoside permease